MKKERKRPLLQSRGPQMILSGLHPPPSLAWPTVEGQQMKETSPVKINSQFTVSSSELNLYNKL